MEMEAAAAVPHAKKRRTEAPEEQEPEEILCLSSDELQQPPVEAPHPKPTSESEKSHGQEPSPSAGGDEEEGIDCISGLPDAVLGEIISLLPTKDAARTQALASRWRHLWHSAPFNLDHGSMPTDEEVQVGIISRILAAHPGPARRLYVPELHLHQRPATVDAWLRSPALDNLQELEFDNGEFLHGYARTALLSLPASAFRFSATLRVATISQCNLLDEAVETLLFPSSGSSHLTVSEFQRVHCIASLPAALSWSACRSTAVLASVAYGSTPLASEASA